MDELTARLDSMMAMITEERTQRLAVEERLRQTQALLEASTAAPPPAPTPAPTPAPAPAAPAPATVVLAKPKAFNGTPGAAAEAFLAQIGLHTSTYPERFPTDSTKVAFAVSFLTDYAAIWAQPYIHAIMEGQDLNLVDFMLDFKAAFFDPNRKNKAEVALRALRQTGTVTAYTQTFNTHARLIGWPDEPLKTLYQQGLKEQVRLSVIVSNIEFESLQAMQAMALKIGNALEGVRSAPPPLSSVTTPAPAPDPNAMDLSAFQQTNRLSDAERTRRFQLQLCFRCGQPGHRSRECTTRTKRTQPSSHQQPSLAKIAEVQTQLQAQMTQLQSQFSSHPTTSTSSPTASSSKNGAPQV